MIVSIEDVKAHLNITTPDDDALIGLKIGVAESFIDGFLAEPMAEMAEVPSALQEAVRQLAAWFYENREGQPVPDGIWQLLNQYREWAF